MKKLFKRSLAAIFFLMFTSTIYAQPQIIIPKMDGYVGIYGGMNLPTGSSISDKTQPFPAIVGNVDIGYDTSYLGGLAVGGFFGDYVGVEASFMYAKPDIASQNLVIPTIGANIPAIINKSIGQNLISGAVSLMVRLPGEKFEPFVGVGPAFSQLEVDAGLISFPGGGSIPLASDSDFSIGFLGTAGLRYFVTDKISIAAMYRYLHSDFTFNKALAVVGPIEERMRLHTLAVMLSYHFKIYSPGIL